MRPGPKPTAYHEVAARAFDRLRGLDDHRCRQIELALFEAASRQLGAPDAADRVHEALLVAPHRGFRDHALDTVRAPKDLKPAIKRIEGGITASQKDQRSVGRDILQRLDVAVSLGELDRDSELWVALKELRALKAEAE